ncbi:MAG TPA: hypothetical protein VK797_04670 [Tepidisphaeraceae bacterium]|jgi:hypothetical protein|nr:hypothetical protein [Tepidisphaeraceae bacterium]
MSTTNLTGMWPWLLRRQQIAREVSPRLASELKPMRRWYRVKVDMDRLRSHLAPESRQRVDERSLRRWLRQSGFVERGDWWVVHETGLGQLAPSEVAEVQPIEV